MVNVLIVAALIIGVAFVLWKLALREHFHQLAESRRKLGTARFTGLMAAILAVIALYVWLSIRLDYPDAYGHPCDGRCLFHDIWYSPVLLRTHRWDEVVLFILFWILPAVLVATGIQLIVRKLRNANLSIHSDEAE